MVKLTGSPSQLFRRGTIVIVATCCTLTFAAVKPIELLPEASRPTAGLSFCQLNVAPGVPLIGTLTGAPAQTVRSFGGFTTGRGLTVMVKF